MLVLRFENKDGKGYFRSGDDYKISNLLGRKDYDYHPHDPHRMPSPSSEKMDYGREHFFGFENWDQMNKSFRSKVRKLINKHCSSKLTVYKIHKNKVIKTKSQVAFIREKAELVYRGRANLSKKELQERLLKINSKYKL